MNVAPGIAFAIPGLRIFKEKERTFLELKNMLELKKGRRNMRKLILILLAVVLLTACGNKNENNQEAAYMNITAEEAKQIMDTETGYIILDVRTQEEYDESHIPGAIVIPNTEIETRAEQELTDKSQMILVYCRSGRRSKQAAEILVALGYTNIKEFGGIIDWPYEVE